MWYLTPRCDLANVIPPRGEVYLQFSENASLGNTEEMAQIKLLRHTCCTTMDGAL